jgi:hypothetical protein
MSWKWSYRAKPRVSSACYIYLGVMLVVMMGACQILPRTCVIAIDEEAVLTEKLALDVTGRALDQVGLGRKNFEPAPFTDDASAPERYFARNSVDKDSGYVLFRRIGLGPDKGVSVHIERTVSSVACRASPWK